MIKSQKQSKDEQMNADDAVQEEKWEMSSTDSNISRLRVPGGWIYKVGEQITFVPVPANKRRNSSWLAMGIT